MQCDEISRTAEYMALFRALESARPRARRLFSDPYARAFLRGRLRAVVSAARISPLANTIVSWVIDRRWPGPRASGVIRTRLIDDAVLAAVADGCSQLVILGAGFDSRAYRLRAVERARVFEVDRPAVLAHKRAALGPVLRQLPDHLTFVALDFEQHALDAALLDAGYQTDRRTCFLWEGVVQYLSAPAVDATLRQIVSLLGAGGRLVFTYVDRQIIEDAEADPTAPRWTATVRRVGEPFTFGWDPCTLPAYLAGRGLALDQDISTADAARALLTPLGRHDEGAGFYRVAIATTASRDNDHVQEPPAVSLGSRRGE